MRRSTIDGLKTEPWEEEEYIIRQVSKFGRTRAVAKRMWDEHAQGDAKRDNEGPGGVLRLWLPKKEFKLQQKETFTEGAAEEGSDRIKKATASDRDGFRRLAHDRGLTLGFGHEFFSGRSTLAEREALEAAKSNLASSSTMSSTGSTTTGGGPSMASSNASEGGKEDGQDGCAEEPPSKRSRKGGANVATVAAKTYEAGVEKLSALKNSVKKLVEKADEAATASLAAPPPADKPASVKTRAVYMRQLEVHRNLARHWLHLPGFLC